MFIRPDGQRERLEAVDSILCCTPKLNFCGGLSASECVHKRIMGDELWLTPDPLVPLIHTGGSLEPAGATWSSASCSLTGTGGTMIYDFREEHQVCVLTWAGVFFFFFGGVVDIRCRNLKAQRGPMRTIGSSDLQVFRDSEASPFPHDGGVNSHVLAGFTGLPAAAAIKSFRSRRGFGRLGGRSAGTPSPSVQVSKNIVVDLAGDFFLLQHFLNSFPCSQCLNLLPLPVFLLLLQGRKVRNCVVNLKLGDLVLH